MDGMISQASIFVRCTSLQHLTVAVMLRVGRTIHQVCLQPARSQVAVVQTLPTRNSCRYHLQSSHCDNTPVSMSKVGTTRLAARRWSS